VAISPALLGAFAGGDGCEAGFADDFLTHVAAPFGLFVGSSGEQRADEATDIFLRVVGADLFPPFGPEGGEREEVVEAFGGVGGTVR